MKNYPPGFTFLLYAVLAVLFSTGLTLLPTALQMRLELNVPLTLNGSQRELVACLHAISFFLTLTLFGALWVVHMRNNWAKRKHINSGGGMVVAVCLLVVSGLGLLYAGDETLVQVSLFVHLGAGPSLMLLFAVHLISALRNKAHKELEKA